MNETQNKATNGNEETTMASQAKRTEIAEYRIIVSVGDVEFVDKDGQQLKGAAELAMLDMMTEKVTDALDKAAYSLKSQGVYLVWKDGA